MMTFISPRLRVPLVYALIGAVFAAAWAVRGGRTWWISILVGIVAIIRIVGTYVGAAGTPTLARWLGHVPMSG
jgi:hypothetical protein